MEINIERMLNDLTTIVNYTKTPGNGCTRFSYSNEDIQTREYLFSQMEKLGLSVKVDAIGNIRAKYGTMIEKPSVMIGSHIDTVENGGKYDGLTGVLAGLEVIRIIQEEKLTLSRPIELVIFAEEEGSNFGITMLGSKVLTGEYGLEDLKSIQNEHGDSVYEIAKNVGLEVENVEKDVLRKDEIDAMIELHIEQGAVLETNNKRIGVVQAIAGMKTFKVTLEGDSNHAGTTPMDLRKDPLVGASTIISHLQKTAKTAALSTTVVTVGKITCTPNMTNVIPQKVEFFVDVRDVEMKGIEFISNELDKQVDEISMDHALTGKIELIGASDSMKLSPRIVGLIEKKAEERNDSYMRMNSGAVHDAAMMTKKTDVGMIFIPSVAGKSHCPEEYTRKEDIKAGGDLLLHVVKALAVNNNEK
ncbi:Zn-dependent hydrolase [Lentibacillus cibarius]|uniref:Zn-dependent hydrolase n=1 Tax=Lentibacillus cibarius TaxID=2583219 RepID=A0A549YJJ6_9BACI|nr:Zn-dependent hydrolase [Lentibacillus cibarius]RYG71327.1 Zn-dependent hydrolase [Lentibacillus lipolyticus]TRM12055.1 Zn-dependent hydrolase [Lentibacillus cibarius]